MRAVPEWHEEKLATKELPVLVLLEGLRTFAENKTNAKDVRRLIASRTREQLERQVLLPYIFDKRWFAAKGNPVKRVEIEYEGEWTAAAGSWLLAFLDVQFENAPAQLYFLPLATAWEERGFDPVNHFGAWTLARVRQKEKTGILFEAFADPRFCRALVRAMGDPKEIPFGSGRLRFSCTSAYAAAPADTEEEVRHPSMDQSNTGIILGNRLYLKGYRRVQAGVNPEWEVGRYLTEVSHFPNIAPVLGALEYVHEDGSLMALALLQQYVENQGSAWSLTHDYIQRFTQRLFTPVDPAAEDPARDELHGFYLAGAERLGQRVGEMHVAFARPSDDPAFAPEPVSAVELASWFKRVTRRCSRDLPVARDAAGRPARGPASDGRAVCSHRALR